MDSRMTKYYDEELENTRFHKNEKLYREINQSELDNYNIKSNATVIGDNKNEIDIEKIKKILDTKYKDAPKRRSIRLEETEEKFEEKEPTKEYDINVILEKARGEKTENYEEERLKRIHDTGFDILKNLDISKKEEEPSKEEENLKNLINTIAINERKNTESSSPLDILTDLKGDDDTEVLEGLKEEIEIKNDEEEEINTKIINSFYTTSNALQSKDFEELDEDFKKSIESNNLALKIGIIIVVILFIVGIYFLIKSLYFS